MRPSWNEIWKRFAIDIAKRSPDPKFQVGAVIVSDDNTQVLALGYNGDHKGGPNCRDSLETGKSGFIHAEQVLYINDYEPDMSGVKILRDCDVSVVKLVDN